MTHDHLTAVLLRDHLLTATQREALLGPAAPGGEAECACLLDRAEGELGLDRANLFHALCVHWHRAAPRVRLHQTTMDPEALAYVEARDAWDTLVLPLAVEPDGHLLCCTTDETLPGAMELLFRTLAIPFRLVITDIGPLELFIAERYDYEGLDVEAA
ncbi:MAG: hypothetical protein AAFX76_05280 [Planctomycetota bacterium]